MPGRAIDGHAKARGEARYVADAVGRPEFYAGLLTTSSPHCRVTVDADGLRALPGIEAVLDHRASAGLRYSTNPHIPGSDTPVFAEEGRFPGDIVGAIAARDRASLRRALARCAEFVHEEPLPAVLSIDEALTGTATANPAYPGNVISDATTGVPAAEALAALAASPLRHTTTVLLDPQPHGFLERLAAAAERTADGWRLWSPSQIPAVARDRLLEMFGGELHMEAVFLGGGFGGKEEVTIEPHVLLLSGALGGARVLLETTRREMTAGYRTRHGGRIEVTTGYDKDGIFRARVMDITLEAGPYNGHSMLVVPWGADAVARLYPRAVSSIRARAVATNRVPGGAFRGYGCTQALFAVETHVDEIAAQVGLDPFEIRRRNLARTGDPDPVTGAALGVVRAVECLDALETMAAGIIREFPRGGVGISMTSSVSAVVLPGILDTAAVACRLDPVSGRVTIETGVAEAGQGMYPLLARIVAARLGLDESRIDVQYAVGGSAARDPGMFASRGAHVTGSAAVCAGELLRQAALEAAAALLSAPVEEIQVDADWSVFRCGPTTVKLAELDPIRVVGEYATADTGLTFGAQLVSVSCDAGTGAAHVLAVGAVHDLGVVIDPDGARTQIEGAVVQGLGTALTEKTSFRADGTAAETGFLNHLIPTAVGTPPVTVEFLPDLNAGGSPSGAKGIGEAGIMGLPAATANAIAAAAGVRARHVPITGERLLRLLDELAGRPARFTGP